MTKKYIYADEAGCFTLSRGPNISKYFIIATITLDDWRGPHLGLQSLRHSLLKKGESLGDYFHATTDSQSVRDSVFSEIQKYNFSIQATICEKSKAQPQVTFSKSRFYKVPWYFHCKFGLLPRIANASEIIVTAASLGTKKERLSFVSGLGDVMGQNFSTTSAFVDFRPCQNDPCMQIADYCAWAIQRKWEKGDTRSYNLINRRITREYDMWKSSDIHYY